MIDELLASVFSIVVLLGAMITHPTSARCPRGWYVRGGVHVDTWAGDPPGTFKCQRPITAPMPRDNGNDTAVPPPGIIRGRVYCGSDSRPVIVTNASVACRRARRLEG